MAARTASERAGPRSGPSDEELITGCRSATPERKRELIGELARRHHRGLLNFIYSFTRDRDAAEDLVQETFIRVYRNAESYQTIAKFSTWLYRIGRNLALNEIRNRRKRPALALNRRVGGDEDGGEVVAGVAGDDMAPAELVEQSDTRRFVRAVVAEIPDGFREVLVLCDLQGMSYQECADVLEIKIGTVRSRLSRARSQFEERMRRALAKAGDRRAGGTDDGSADG